MAGQKDWTHDIDSPQRTSVSDEVNRRRYGAVETPSPDELRAEEGGRRDDGADGFADKWERRFAHLPGVEPSNASD